MTKLYSNGYTADQQRSANHRYQARQRQQREWISSVAEQAGISRESLLTTSNAAVVAEILRRGGGDDPPP